MTRPTKKNVTAKLLCAQVMPLLRHVLGAASDRSHALLRAKALECISLVGMAVGREQFRQDAHAVMQLMQTLQARARTMPPASPAAPSHRASMHALRPQHWPQDALPGAAAGALGMGWLAGGPCWEYPC